MHTCVSENTKTWIMYRYVVACLFRIDPEQEPKFQTKQSHKSEVSDCCRGDLGCDWQCLCAYTPPSWLEQVHGAVSCAWASVCAQPGEICTKFCLQCKYFTVSCIYFNGETADSLCVLSGAFDWQPHTTQLIKSNHTGQPWKPVCPV